MSRFPALAVVAVVAVLGVASSSGDVCSAFQQNIIVVPSSSSTPNSSSNNKRVGTALQISASTTGDIGDNLYLDGPSTRSQSSTYRPLFNGQATTPVDNFNQRRQAGRNTGNGGRNSVSGLFGRNQSNNNRSNRSFNNRNNRSTYSNNRSFTLNNNANNRAAYGHQNRQRSGGRYDVRGPGGLNVPFGGTGARRMGTVTDSSAPSLKVASQNPGVARKKGVRLSDVGKVRSRTN